MERNLAKLVEMNGDDGRLYLQTYYSREGPLGIVLLELAMDPLGQLEPKPSCECSEERLNRNLRLLPPRVEVDTFI